MTISKTNIQNSKQSKNRSFPSSQTCPPKLDNCLHLQFAPIPKLNQQKGIEVATWDHIEICHSEGYH